MKLSEAIRLGALLRPQAFGAFFVRDGSCALGAAAEAIGCRRSFVEAVIVLRLKNAFPTINNLTHLLPCPVCAVNGISVVGIITHLNDGHAWSRDAIATFVDSLETLESQQTTKLNQLAELCS